MPATQYQSAINPSAPPCPTTCTEFGWEIYPEGFRQVLDIAGDYRLPVIVTENGISDSDDDQRAAYLTSHLEAVRQAMRAKEADVARLLPLVAGGQLRVGGRLHAALRPLRL